jgi:BirA family biotin operon repressor/biotin-[acetyl-CoA-carboxylase] ligase
MMNRRRAPDLEGLAELLAARCGRLGRPLRILDQTTSTNDEAKQGAREGEPHGALWVAESQTAGRGRLGRSWVSPRGENLLFSVLLRIACPPPRVPSLALVAGLAVRDAVARAIGDDARVLVKWPNDVLVGGKKVAGVLVESQIVGARVESAVVGIGINVHTRSFPDEIAAVATSVALSSTRTPHRAEILADVLARLDHDVEHVARKGLGLVHARLVEHDALRGREVVGDDIRGVAAGIDTDGRLLVQRPDGTTARVVSGEVTLMATR